MRKSIRSSPPAVTPDEALQKYSKRMQHVPKLAALASQPPRHQELSKWLAEFFSVSTSALQCSQIIFGPLSASAGWPVQSSGEQLLPSELIREIVEDLNIQAKNPYRSVKLGDAWSKALQRRYPSISQATLQALHCGAFWVIVMPARTQADKSVLSLTTMLLDSALLHSAASDQPSPLQLEEQAGKKFDQQGELPGFLICTADLQPLYANEAILRWFATAAPSFSTPPLSHLHSLIMQHWTHDQPVHIDFDLQMQIAAGGNGYAQILPFTLSEKKYVALLVHRGLPPSVTQKELATATIHSALSRLAGGLIHEINNPTTSILNYARLLQMKSISSAEADEFTQSIVDETERMAALTHNMQLSIGDDAAKLQRVSLNQLLSTVLDLNRSRFSHDRITLEHIFDNALPEALCRKDHLIVALMLIIQNARLGLNARMPGEVEEKILRISTRNIKVGSTHFAQAVIADNGIGIAPDIESLIFTPFFSAWPDHRRAGMGLFVARSIARAHGGDLVLLKTSRLKTAFALHLPAEQ